MITVSHTGPGIADVIASVRAVPEKLVPYAAATALTRTAKAAQTGALPDAMRAAFDSPTRWTLNSLRLEPATKDKLSARVHVKDMGAAVTPEKTLLAQVDGGVRGKKRAERALQYMGVLSGDQYAMPGAGLDIDSDGNVRGSDVRQVLTLLKRIRSASNTRSNSSGRRLRKGGALQNDLFVGKPRGGDRANGIWRREGHRLRALFIITSRAPQYRPRLDFSGIVADVARTRFKAEFDRAIAEQMAKGSWA